MEQYFSRRRKDIDIKKLLNNKGIEVMLIDHRRDLFEVVWHGPKDSLYKDGVWRICLCVPSNYPNKPPVLLFMDEIFHPNISGSFPPRILDVPSEAWRETYDLVYMFEQFLPQLLRHPNPENPINHKAAELLKHNKEEFDRTVRRYCLSHGKRPETGSEGGIGSSNQHRNP